MNLIAERIRTLTDAAHLAGARADVEADAFHAACRRASTLEAFAALAEQLAAVDWPAYHRRCASHALAEARRLAEVRAAPVVDTEGVRTYRSPHGG